MASNGPTNPELYELIKHVHGAVELGFERAAAQLADHRKAMELGFRNAEAQRSTDRDLMERRFDRVEDRLERLERRGGRPRGI